MTASRCRRYDHRTAGDRRRTIRRTISTMTTPTPCVAPLLGPFRTRLAVAAFARPSCDPDHETRRAGTARVEPARGPSAAPAAGGRVVHWGSLVCAAIRRPTRRRPPPAGPRRCVAAVLVGLVVGSPIGLATANAAAADAPCTLAPNDLRGAWTSQGDGFFEQMAFGADGDRRSFDSWLHDRPEIVDATWSLDRCVLRIVPKDDAMPPFVYRARIGRGHRLELRDESGAVARYRRSKG